MNLVKSQKITYFVLCFVAPLKKATGSDAAGAI